MNYCWAKNLVVRKLDDQRFLVLISGGDTIWEFNEVGSVLWEALKRSQSVKTLVKRVCKGYEVDERTALSDVIDFLEENVKRKLLIEC